ncbi:transcription initiation factor IIB [Haloarchaeobius sp. DFWS5]|uniref:transcription initiation factor IIB n=1 Tax=Haloarchaeobius sp. DFWS5 TaxID=3446114 RepID=UPI003EB7E28E
MASRHIYATSFDECERLPIDLPCPECDGDLERERRQTYCVDCGLVVREYEIDHGPDWFDNNDGRTSSRIGSPLTPSRHDDGLSTEIGSRKDAKGNVLSSRTRRRFSRLRREHSRARTPTKRSRNALRGLVDVRRIASEHELPRSVRDRAATLFREAQAENLLPGRSVNAMAAGSVYAACRCFDLPRTLDEFEPVARCDYSALRNAYMVLQSELGLHIAPPSPSTFVPRYAARFDVGEATQFRALELARQLEETGRAIGRAPTGVAAACIYVAAQEHDETVYQTDLADAAHVTPVTVRARRDEIQELTNA